MYNDSKKHLTPEQALSQARCKVTDFEDARMEEHLERCSECMQLGLLGGSGNHRFIGR